MDNCGNYDNYIKTHMKNNDDVYRNALERIVQKYSRVDGSSMEVCLRSMLCRTEKGFLPWGGNEAERRVESQMSAMEHTGLSAGQEFTGDIQQDDSQTCNEISSVSVEMERSTENVSWASGVLSDSSLQGEPVQPEEQDEELERTLSSQGSLLLHLYPSMLSQVGRAWHRQKTTEAANTVRRRYRRWGWRSSAQKPPPRSPAPKLPPHSPTPKLHPCSPAPKLHPHSSSSKLHPHSPAPKLHPHSSSPKLHPHSPAPKLHPHSSSSKLHPHSPAPKLHPHSSSSKLHPHSPAPKLPPHSPTPKLHPCSPAPNLHPHHPSPKLHPHSPASKLPPRSPASKLHPHSPAPKLYPHSPASKLHPHHPSPRSAHEPWRRSLQEGGVGQGADPVLMMDSSSSPELSPLCQTYTVSCSPPTPPSLSLPSAPPLYPGSAHSTQPLFQRQSPQPSYLKWGPASPSSPLPHRPRPPGGSGRSQRCQSLREFQAVRHQIDQQFEEVYQRLVCKRRPTPSLLGPACLLPSPSSSSSLAALALSPAWTRVRKRAEALDPRASPEPKRFRKRCACSPGSARHLRQHWACCCGHAHPHPPHSAPPHRPSTPPQQARTSALWGRTFQNEPSCGPGGQRDELEGQTCRPPSHRHSPVLLTDRQRGFSLSSSRRRLLYGLPQ